MYPSYEKFLKLKESGLRQNANQIAPEVVSEFWESPSRDFISILCEVPEHHKINYILWRGIVFQWIKPRIETEAFAIRCLLKTIQNLYGDKEAHKQVGYLTEEDLTRQLFRLEPNNTWAKQQLLTILIRCLEYTIHEWPMGVLYGRDGATLEQCDEILEAVQELRFLDTDGLHYELASDVESKTRAYKLRLAKAH